MSFVKTFPEVAYWSEVKCPFCGEDKPVIAQGLVKVGKDIKMCPDRGYAFCNCKNVWYTDWSNIDAQVEMEPEQDVEIFRYHIDKDNIENGGYQKNRLLVCGDNGSKIKEEAKRLGFDVGEHELYNTIWSYHKIEHVKDPIQLLKEYYEKLERGGRLFLATPDPFFIEFENVYNWAHWMLREHHIMWDMDSLVDEVEKVGFTVCMMMRNTEVSVQRDMHLVFRK